MLEIYVLVEQKKGILLKFFEVFSYVMAAFAGLLTFLGAGIFFPVILMGIAVGYYFHTRNFEYEYSYFDGDVRFAKITNKSKRKRLPGYKMEEIVIIAPAGDRSVYQYENDRNAKVRDLSSGYADRDVYVMVAKSDNGVEVVRFEPDEKYLNAVCIKYAQKVKR